MLPRPGSGRTVARRPGVMAAAVHCFCCPLLDESLAVMHGAALSTLPGHSTLVPFCTDAQQVFSSTSQ